MSTIIRNVKTKELHKPQNYSGYYYYKTNWILNFVWLPKICDLSGRVLWLEWAYRGIAVLIKSSDLSSLGNEYPKEEYRWHDKNAHLIWEIKGKP